MLPADAPFAIGRAPTLREGGDLTLASHRHDRSPRRWPRRTSSPPPASTPTVLHFGTVKPFDARALADAAARTGAVVTVEEHSVLGGLGSAAAEAIADDGAGARLLRLGFRDTFAHAVGSREHLLRHYGLAAADIAAAAQGLLARPALTLELR